MKLMRKRLILTNAFMMIVFFALSAYGGNNTENSIGENIFLNAGDKVVLTLSNNEQSQIEVNGIHYALKSDNLFINGSFDQGVDGWKTVGYTTNAVIGNFTYNTSGGFDGGAYITTNGNSPNSEKTLRQSVAVEVGKTYYFSVYTSGKAPKANDYRYNALFQMTDATTENGVLKEFEWPQGALTMTDVWSKTEYVFTASSPYVGVRMGWNENAKFDGFELYEVERLTSDLDVAKKEAKNKIKALSPIGDGLFYYSQADINMALASVDAATTVAEVNAVTMPAPQPPVKGIAYVFSLFTSKGVFGLKIDKDKGIIIVENDASNVYFTDVGDGKYAISDNQYYVNYRGDNAWSLAASTDAFGWKFSALKDGGYTISGQSGFLGTDAIDDGAACYGNKTTSNGNYVWQIEPLSTINITLDIQRYAGLGDTPTKSSMDIAEAKQFLGVQNLTSSMLRIVNPNGVQISDYSQYEGWFDESGYATAMGNNAKICVKFFQALPGGAFEISDMNGADVVGKTYTVKWALTANDRTINYTINVKYVKAPPLVLEQSDLSIHYAVEYAVAEQSNTEKIVTLSDKHVKDICQELEITDIKDAKVYGYNATTGTLISDYTQYDGWRDKYGDFHIFTGNTDVPACVKYSDGKKYYCYNVKGSAQGTIPAYWAFANDYKYVLVRIDVKYAQKWVDDDVVKIVLSEPGDLSLQVALLDEDDVTNLKIVGPMNATDLIYLRSGSGKLANLEQLDLGEVTLIPDESIYYAQGQGLTPNGAGGMTGSTITYYYISDRDTVIYKGSSNGLGGTNVTYNVYSSSLAGFFEKSNIVNVTLPNGVTDIGVACFRESNIRLVRTSGPIKSVGILAFSGCKELTAVDLSEAKYIGIRAFEKCKKLTTVGSLANVRKIGYSCFSYCSSLDFGSQGMDLSLLDSIPYMAFNGNELLKKVNISSSLKWVGEKAFYNCVLLNNVVLPETCTKVEAAAFSGCTALDNMSVTPNLINVESDFIDNTPLLSKDVKNGVHYLQHIAIKSVDKNATTISLREGTTTVANRFHTSASYNNTKLETLALPSTLIRIGDRAFYNAIIKTLTLPSVLREIGEEAFYKALKTTKLTIPENVEYIGSRAFSGNTDLTSLEYYSKMLETFYLNDNKTQTSNNESIFSSCTGLVKVNFGPNVRAIPTRMFSDCSALVIVAADEQFYNTPSFEMGMYAFYQCTSLRAVDFLPKSTRVIPSYAFFKCEALKSLAISPNIQTIEEGAFGQCTGIKSITVENSDEPLNWSKYGDAINKNMETVYQGRNIIGKQPFAETNITSLTFSDKVTAIEKDAFNNCTKLTDIIIPNSVITIGAGAFQQCTALKSIRLSDNLISIGGSAFYNCAALESITVPQGVTEINEYTFSGCKQMTSATLNQGIAAIGKSAFSACSQLESINIPEGVTELSQNCFNGCSAMKSVVIPSTVEKIDFYVFNNCSSLTSITSLIKQPIYVSYDVFDKTHFNNATLYVPYGTLGLYKKKSAWSEFLNIQELPNTTVVYKADNKSMTYGDNLPTLTYTMEGINATGIPELSCEATSQSPVGTYPIVISAGSVVGDDVSFVNGKLTVNKAILTVKVQSCSCEQGQAFPTFEYTIEGFKNNENENVLTKKPVITCNANSNSIPGTYNITVSGAEAENYDFKYVGGTLTITEAVVVNPVIENGVYYIYNACTSKFMSRGSWWGTRAVGDDYGLPINVMLNNGTYTLQSVDNGKFYGDDYWMYADCTGERIVNFKIEEVDGGYQIINTNLNLPVYINNTDGTFDYGIAGNGTLHDNYEEKEVTVWEFLTQQERDAIIAERELSSKNAVFSVMGVKEDDTLVESNITMLTFKTGSNWTFTPIREQSNATTNEFGTEVYQGTGTFTQTIDGLTAGLYQVCIQAFYRDGRNEDVAMYYNAGYNLSTSYLDANGSRAQVLSWGADRMNDNYPNGMEEASVLFSQGKYKSVAYAIVGSEGTLRLTVVIPSVLAYGWFMADNVSISKLNNIPTEIDEIVSGLGNAKIFTIDGRHVDSLQKGINIIRYENGETKKVISK